MVVDYFPIIVACLLGVYGLFKREKLSFTSKFAIALLIFISAISQVYLTYQKDIENKKSLLYGTLKGSTIEKFPILEIGNSGAQLRYTGPPGSPLIVFDKDTSLNVQIEDGQLKISTIVRNREGIIVAELKNNEWMINENQYYDRNYTKDALEVIDSSGDVVLQIRLKEDRVQLQGKFYDKDGNGFVIAENPKQNGSKGGIIGFTNEKGGKLTPDIKPIFQYPSELHFGKLAISPNPD